MGAGPSGGAVGAAGVGAGPGRPSLRPSRTPFAASAHSRCEIRAWGRPRQGGRPSPVLRLRPAPACGDRRLQGRFPSRTCARNDRQTDGGAYLRARGWKVWRPGLASLLHVSPTAGPSARHDRSAIVQSSNHAAKRQGATAPGRHAGLCAAVSLAGTLADAPCAFGDASVWTGALTASQRNAWSSSAAAADSWLRLPGPLRCHQLVC